MGGARACVPGSAGQAVHSSDTDGDHVRPSHHRSSCRRVGSAPTGRGGHSSAATPGNHRAPQPDENHGTSDRAHRHRSERSGPGRGRAGRPARGRARRPAPAPGGVAKSSRLLGGPPGVPGRSAPSRRMPACPLCDLRLVPVDLARASLGSSSRSTSRIPCRRRSGGERPDWSPGSRASRHRWPANPGGRCGRRCGWPGFWPIMAGSSWLTDQQGRADRPPHRTRGSGADPGAAVRPPLAAGGRGMRRGRPAQCGAVLPGVYRRTERLARRAASASSLWVGTRSRLIRMPSLRPAWRP